MTVGLSQLCEHKFKGSFQDCLNPLNFCGNDTETSTHHPLHCLTNERMSRLSKTKSINCDILEFSDAVMTKILLEGDSFLSASSNILTLNSTIDYIRSAKRFDNSIAICGCLKCSFSSLRSFWFCQTFN